MNATIITSQEYRLNSPSVFAVINGNYYGCMIYPSVRNFPAVEYWGDATSSDSDRGFFIKKAEVTEEQLELIIKLQQCCNANKAMIKSISHPEYPQRDFKIKRGKAFEEYTAKCDQWKASVADEQNYNKPYYNAYWAAYHELKNILTSI